jgi:ABC-type Fe3+-hydroxamate transport system substrate-binding protein
VIIHDALGRLLEIRKPPARIVSLVPSLTELLFELGAGERVVAATDYCIHPAGALGRLPRVGGQKDPDLAQLIALHPELVIVAKEENLRRDVERLEAAGVPVYVTDVQTLDDALRLPFQLGAAAGVPRARAEALHDRMAEGVAAARRTAEAHATQNLRVVCFVWRDPWIAAGGDTYISDVLAACGARNLFADQRRYPKIDLAAARALGPDAILLPSEPYPFSEADLPSVERGLLVDGTVLCWYGPRTARIAELASILSACATSMR